MTDPLEQLDSQHVQTQRTWRVDPRDIAHLPLQQREDILEHEMGLDVEAFLRTTYGQYLYGRARQQWIEARHGLMTVDPHDPQAIIALQQKAQVATMFLEFCLQPIREGEQAATRIEEADQAHDETSY